MKPHSTRTLRTFHSRIGGALLCVAVGVASAQAQSFQGIGDLPGGVFDSACYGVSADGSTVVGASQSANGLEAVRWRASGLIGLGDLAGGPFQSFAVGANFDGSVLVGSGRDASVERAVRWDGTLVSLIPQVGGHSGYAGCNGISSNGQDAERLQHERHELELQQHRRHAN
jgi:uncharacterized membrane protein